METTRTNIEHAMVCPEYLYNDTTSSASESLQNQLIFMGRRKRHAIMFYCVHMPVVFSKGAKPSGMDWRLLASAPGVWFSLLASAPGVWFSPLHNGAAA